MAVQSFALYFVTWIMQPMADSENSDFRARRRWDMVEIAVISIFIENSVDAEP